MRRALLLFAVAIVLMPACGGTDRPEGIVERWLISLNQGKAGEPEKYAPDALSQRILPKWQARDPGDLDVIEVGKGERSTQPLRRLPPGHRYRVPYRVIRVDGQELSGSVELVSPHSKAWQVEDLLPAEAGLLVPSKGGKRVGEASAGAWLTGIGIAVALILLSVLLMSTVGRAVRVTH